MSEVVVLVHGIWMNGLELRLLGRQLRRCGYTCRYFRYPSLRRSPAENAQQLQAFLTSIEADKIHLVAHSLGGIVIAHLLAQQSVSTYPGRVVMLGTPLQGSVVARHLARRRAGRWLLGQSVERGLLGDAPAWAAGQETGMIAGCWPVGIGRWLAPGKLSKPHDGTVMVHETRAAAIHQHVEVKHSHLGMLFARDVARLVCGFLRQGYFT